jgi:Mn2+/Fe2+ NRAMP family transporter
MNELKTRIVEFYRNEKEITIIGGLSIATLIIQLIITECNITQSLMSVLVQFLSSWLLAFVSVQYSRKYYNAKLLNWWTGWYITIILLSVISSNLILGIKH